GEFCCTAERDLVLLIPLGGEHEPAFVDEFPHCLGHVTALFFRHLVQEIKIVLIHPYAHCFGHFIASSRRLTSAIISAFSRGVFRNAIGLRVVRSFQLAHFRARNAGRHGSFHLTEIRWL